METRRGRRQVFESVPAGPLTGSVRFRGRSRDPPPLGLLATAGCSALRQTARAALTDHKALGPARLTVSATKGGAMGQHRPSQVPDSRSKP